MWKSEVERIRQATGLPIEIRTCPIHECDRVQTECAAEEREIVAMATVGSEVRYVVIEKQSWPESARALLPLLLGRISESDKPLSQQVIAWLQDVLAGKNAAPPARLEQSWNWRDRRTCFLLERTRTEGSFDVESLPQLLSDFFTETSVTLLPLTPVYQLLIVPLSALGGNGEQGELLEWASSLHDLLTTETMEPVRALAAPPIEQPSMLPEVLNELILLSQALQKYRPRIMAAGTWQYPLERWATTLDPSAVSAIREQLATSMSFASLHADQLETLETFFAQGLNVSETARQLFLHRNTLLYRLDKLTELTGLDPRRFDEAVLLQIFLLFRQK